MKPVRIGGSGWMYDEWRGRLYPDKLAKRRWLEEYARHFDPVEVNSTFYRLARREAVAGWVSQTPPEFEFAVKASRYLTHVKRLFDIREGIKRFYEPLEPMIEARRLGPVLWQLPENFHRDDARLAAWLELLPSGRHTIEFRHPSWFVPEVLSLLRAGVVALTIGDHPERGFQLHDATADWRFVRFPLRGARPGWELLRKRDRDVGAADRPVAPPRGRYAYFNNDWQGFATANAKLLLRRPGEQPYTTA